MSDPRNVLKGLFKPANRFANFGDLISKVRITGFRCHADTVVEFESPITAFCGLNGCGKSTILQLCAVAYRSPSTDVYHYYVKDFLVVGTLDAQPFTTSASVEFKFWQDDQSEKPLTLSRSDKTKRWQGYRRRPIRRVLFAGVGLYLPKIEQRDFIVRYASQLLITASTQVVGRIKDSICQILGIQYDDIQSNSVKLASQSGTVVSVDRSGVRYSEAHMGYGEGRTQHLITMLETLPDKSLVLIEEPETSLHPSAQHQFGKYLVDVCVHKRHQILITTHSDRIMEALPAESQIYLKRTAGGIVPVPGLTPSQAYSLMDDGRVRSLHVLVEDKCAREVVREIVSKADPTFLRTIDVHAVGDANTIATTMRALRSTGLPVAAVRDAEQSSDPAQNLFKLPGQKAPERELFGGGAVKEYFRDAYEIHLDDFVAGLGGSDHHSWFKQLAEKLNRDEMVLMNEAARAYVSGLTGAEIDALVNPLKASMAR